MFHDQGEGGDYHIVVGVILVVHVDHSEARHLGNALSAFQHLSSCVTSTSLAMNSGQAWGRSGMLHSRNFLAQWPQRRTVMTPDGWP
jgi:hypothetical protein